MNNKTQKQFDRSVKGAVSASDSRQNDRITRQRWAREDRGIVIAVTPSRNLDEMIAELVARDGLQAE